jgi:4-amino-4-deoxy-L-arabinose transferase-like glycosyltransferase
MSSTPATASDRTPFADRWLLGLMAGGLGVRVAAAVLLDPGMNPRGDEHVYIRHARELLETGNLETGWFVRPPLYFLFMAATHSLSDGLAVSWTLLAKWLQCIASVATAIPVFLGARRIAGTRAARFAAAFLLFDPTLIGYTHLLWPETLFTLLVAIVFNGVADLDQRSGGRSVFLGAMTGLAMLFKPVFGLFALLWAGSWLIQLGWSRALRQVLLVGGAAVLVVSPWVIRNQLRYGPSILLENQGPYNLWIGNSKQPPTEVLRQWRQLDDPVYRSELALERGVAAISEDPAGFARSYFSRLVNLWGLEFFVFRHDLMGGYGMHPRWGLQAMFWSLQIGWALSLLAACAGLGRGSRDPTIRLLLVYAASFTLMVAALVGTTRFRVPFAYLIAVLAGIGVDQAIARGITRKSLAAIVLAGAMLCVSAGKPLFWKMITDDFVDPREFHNTDWFYFRY